MRLGKKLKNGKTMINAETEDNRLVVVPKDYLIGPVFAAVPQNGSREVTIGSRKYLLGGFNPLKANLHPPALDVRHARAIFTMLSFRDPICDDSTRIIRFSMNEFCRRYADSQGGRYSRAIAGILGDLLDGYMRVTDTETGIAHEYRFIERIDIERIPIRRRDASLATTKQMEMWLNGCTLSQEFYDLMKQVAELQHLRLDALNTIRSPLAQAIYLFLPSRAIHHSTDDPFEITLTRLLEQVSFPIPSKKYQRKQLFKQHEDEGRSLLQQLDGRKTLSGRFRCTLADTADGLDWKLQCWIERNVERLVTMPPKENSKLKKAFLASGRTEADWSKMLTHIVPLSGYECDLITVAGIDIEKGRRFYEATRAVLGESRFVSILAEAKAARLEKRPTTKTPGHRLTAWLMEAVRVPPALPKR
jgi:hypothetical protein